jgi:hypothetical protein
MRQLGETVTALSQKPYWADSLALEAGKAYKLAEVLARPISLDALGLTGQYLTSLASSGAVDQIKRWLDAEKERSVQTRAVLASLESEDVGDHIARMLETTKLAESAIGSMEWVRLGSLAHITDTRRLQLQALTDTLGTSYSDIIAGAADPNGMFAALPPFVTRTPPENLFVHSNAVRSISEHAEYDEQEQQEVGEERRTILDGADEFLLVTLPKLKKPLVGVYEGALSAIERKGADWPRHAADSLRQLLQSVLHNAATDEDVTPWAKEHHGEFDAAGHPTRRTKVKWLCQQIPSKGYRKFVQADIESALDLIGVCDEVVHLDAAPWFEESFEWALARMKVAIKHILEIWTSRN